eukprot:333427-Pleurochrysis_carterae.AAC.1
MDGARGVEEVVAHTKKHMGEKYVLVHMFSSEWRVRADRALSRNRRHLQEEEVQEESAISVQQT